MPRYAQLVIGPAGSGKVCIHPLMAQTNNVYHRPIIRSLFTLNPQCHRVINKTSALSDSPT